MNNLNSIDHGQDSILQRIIAWEDTEAILGACFEELNTLGHGLLEKV